MSSVTYNELFHFVFQFIKPQRWAFGFIFFIDCFAWSLDALLWPYILHLLIDIFTKYEGNRLAAWESLQGPILGAISLVLFVEIASRTMGFMMAKAMPKLQADIRMEMFDHIQHHSPQYFNERFAGSLANKITDMTSQVETIIQQLFWPLVPALSTCLLGAGFLWFVNPLFAWFLLFWVVVHVTICLLFTRNVDEVENRHGETRSVLLGKIVDSLTNNFAVNLFYRFHYEKSAVAVYQRVEKESNEEAKWYVEKMRCYLSLFYVVAVIIGMFGTMLYMWMQGLITTGQVVQVFTTMWSLTMILWSVGSVFPLLFQSLGTIRQAYSVMSDPQDIGDKFDSTELVVSSGEIVFDSVSFRYGEKQLFENKRVQIEGGERVGLVGYTGAGKSTFINLILRFFLLESGRILIDGQDISHVSLESLRKNIALIPQEPILFHRSLWDNIIYGKPEATEEEVYRAAILAHCDGFIRSLPAGYGTKVGERGTKLSGGEKQRIAIARAILVNAPILLLDEATSSLDSVTEQNIQESLEALMKNRTTIVIAHRLSTLSRMDRILVFDQGQIVEEGTHVSLLKQGGLYAKMWNMQVGGFLPENPL